MAPRLLVSLLCSLVLLAVPSSAVAAQSSFSVAPLSLTGIRLNPGQSITGTLEVSTPGAPGSFEVAVGEASQATNGTPVLKGQSEDPNHVSSWIAVGPDVFTSEAGGVQPVTWTVAVPESAKPGDYVGLIYVRRAGKPGGKTQEYAVRADINVRGEVKFNPVIEQVKVPEFSNGDKFRAKVRFTNRGNTHLDLTQADARLEFVVDGKVQRLFRLDGSVMPGVSRVWTFAWDDPPRFARATTRVVIEFPEAGKRDALTVKREEKSWMLPVREMFFALVALVALGVVARVLMARRRDADGIESDPMFGPEVDDQGLADPADPQEGADAALDDGPRVVRLLDNDLDFEDDDDDVPDDVGFDYGDESDRQ